jgi:alanyl-tRNA synthetase
MTDEEIKKVEQIVNEKIVAEIARYHRSGYSYQGGYG